MKTLGRHSSGKTTPREAPYNGARPEGEPALSSGEGPAQPAPALQVLNLSTGYNHDPVLEDISFEVAKGEILGILGPNGSGKSTLMKAILGLVKPWEGRILVQGQSGPLRRRRVGYMPQIELVDWDFPVTVGDVALMGRYSTRGLLRGTNREDRDAAHAALERMGMYRVRHRLIGELSGGQRRRVLLARALAHGPDLLLLDEPVAGLDATAQHLLLDIIEELRAGGTTIVLTTHDLSCVSGWCAKAACLNRRLIAFGAPTDILNERVLGETFGTHLLLVHMDGQAYAYQHHRHSPPGPADSAGGGPAKL